MEKMHYLKWDHSRLNIRCWQCSEILVTISTDGSSLNFNSIVEYLEINCPICHTSCEYSLIDKDDGLFKSHDWDSDIDSLDFDGQTGEVNRNLLRQYKTLLLADEASKKFMENEFYIVGDYLEFLSEMGKDGSLKNDEDIANYLNECKENDYVSKNREKFIRRAINRLYRLRKVGRFYAEPRGNMKNLSLYKKYTAAELGKELNFSKRLTNGIRKNFGDLISLYELKQINWSEFRACKGFGLKSWYKFREAMSQIEDTDKAVKVIDKKHHPKKIIVEIDISEPFDKVIQDLTHIITERK